MTIYHHLIPECFGLEIKEIICGSKKNANGKYKFVLSPFFKGQMYREDSVVDEDDSIITFVSHPYKRIIRLWDQIITPNKKRPPIVRLIQKYLCKYSDLNDFLVNGEEDYLIINQISAKYIFNSMSFFCNGDWDKYDNIYNCEDLHNEFLRFINDYDITPMNDISDLDDVIETSFTIDDLSQESKDIIYERYKPDFNQFNFSR